MSSKGKDNYPLHCWRKTFTSSKKTTGCISTHTQLGYRLCSWVAYSSMRWFKICQAYSPWPEYPDSLPIGCLPVWDARWCHSCHWLTARHPEWQWQCAMCQQRGIVYHVSLQHNLLIWLHLEYQVAGIYLQVTKRKVSVHWLHFYYFSVWDESCTVYILILVYIVD